MNDATTILRELVAMERAPKPKLTDWIERDAYERHKYNAWAAAFAWADAQNAAAQQPAELSEAVRRFKNAARFLNDVNALAHPTGDMPRGVDYAALLTAVSVEPSPAQPAGFGLVPVEPTPAMSAAGFCVSEAEHDPAGVYRAMLAARPVVDIDAMVNRFLTWPLPKTFGPDCGISFVPQRHYTGELVGWPTGTNLFTANEAKAMLEHVLGIAASAQEPT